MSVTTCETIPFRPIIQNNNIHQYHQWGKLRSFMDPLNNRTAQFPQIRWARPLLCGTLDAVPSLKQICRTLGISNMVKIPKYIVMETYENWYLFAYYTIHPLQNYNDNILGFQWMPMSLVCPGASYYSTKEDEEVVYAKQGLGVTFEIRQSTLTNLIQETQKNSENCMIQVWGFDTLPTLDEAIRQERTTRLLQFRMAKQVTECGTLVANAAIMGAPLEFKTRMYHFTKQKRWKLIPIKPRDGLLTDAQKAEEPKPLSHWIQRETCLKLHGDKGYHNMMDTLMDYAMV